MAQSVATQAIPEKALLEYIPDLNNNQVVFFLAKIP